MEYLRLNQSDLSFSHLDARPSIDDCETAVVFYLKYLGFNRSRRRFLVQIDLIWTAFASLSTILR